MLQLSGTCCPREQRLSQIRIDEMHFAILHLMHLNSSRRRQRTLLQ